MTKAQEDHFKKTAPKYMAMFMKDFDASVLDAAAVFGNAGHESKGLTDDQEDNPIAGRGGLNWFQWTGPRRVAFEKYCVRNGYDANSDIAAYKWLFVELKTTEKKALIKLKAASSLYEKVVAFENAYERAGIKHYDSRLKWAQMALQAYNDTPHVGVYPEAPDSSVQPSMGSGGLFAILAEFIMGLLSSIFKTKDKK